MGAERTSMWNDCRTGTLSPADDVTAADSGARGSSPTGASHAPTRSARLAAPSPAHTPRELHDDLPRARTVRNVLILVLVIVILLLIIVVVRPRTRASGPRAIGV